MKVFIVLFLGIVAIILIAGCSSIPVSPPVTTPPATMTPEVVVTTAPPPITDPELVGGWILQEMGLQGGEGIINVFTAPITATFYTEGNVIGNGGCNNYNAPFTLTGITGPFGKGITIGPIVSTLMYCVGTSDMEATYFQILQNVTSYSIDNGQILSLRDPRGSVLVYHKI